LADIMSLRLFRQELAHEDEMAEPTAWADARVRGAGARVIKVAGARVGANGRAHNVLGALHVQQQTGFAGEGTLACVPKAEISNLVQPFGQDVLEEAAHELLTIEGANAPAIGLAVVVAERDGVLVEADDARIGDGNAKDVTREISKDRLLALAPWGDPDDPGYSPGTSWNDEVGVLLRKPRLELAAHELGDGRLGGKEGGARGMPARDSCGGDTATGNEAMHVGVIVELLGPSIENS